MQRLGMKRGWASTELIDTHDLQIAYYLCIHCGLVIFSCCRMGETGRSLRPMAFVGWSSDHLANARLDLQMQTFKSSYSEGCRNSSVRLELRKPYYTLPGRHPKKALRAALLSGLRINFAVCVQPYRERGKLGLPVLNINPPDFRHPY